jgi:hypothetical protein
MTSQQDRDGRMSSHPYRGLPADQFWSTAVAPVAAEALDPVRDVKFTFAPHTPVAAAGSCFAQHIARHLQQSGYRYLQLEQPATPAEPVFSARFGNIYTLRQLHQLLLAAYGLHRPATPVWKRADGRFIDPLRPQLFPAGFATPDDTIQERRRHLEAVRRVFQECRIFVFTLGLTEAWLAPDGTVLPVPPGVVDVTGAEAQDGAATYHNFTADEMRQDMERFLTDLIAVNPDVQVILTVSPVPLVATYEPRHVLISNTYSKAVLRVVAEETAACHDNVAYFPSYEIITAPQSRGAYFEADLRSVTAAGVAHVMRVFSAHLMRADSAPAPRAAPKPAPPIVPSQAARASYAALSEIICDEELLETKDRP